METRTESKIAFSDVFFSSLIKLPKTQQKKVDQFIKKFRTNSKSSGINYEKINDAANPLMRSVRIDNTYRGIILKPEVGSIHLLLWVDHHDDAYAWARSHQCKINPETGVIQLYQSRTIVKEVKEKPLNNFESKPEKQKSLLFADFTKNQFARIGLPIEFNDQIFSLMLVEQLQSLKNALPVDAYEALSMIAEGLSYEEVLSEYNDNVSNEVIDINDYESAIKRSGSQRRFVLVEDEDIQKMLDAPLEKWRVFLHPSQQKIINRNWNGPVRVLGGAGTGKTVVAMHRAKWLASDVITGQPKKVLFTTFTKNLATDIKVNLGEICSKEELHMIEVTNIDAWVSQFVRRHNFKYRIVFTNDSNQLRSKCWKMALQNKPEELSFSKYFYQDEWRLIIQENSITSLHEYIKVKRSGRGTRLNRSERMLIWPVFEEYIKQLEFKNLREMTDATKDCLQIIKTKKIKPLYQSVIVDEGQDMGTHVYSLLRAIVAEQKNDMFIVGDGHQRIYQSKVVLGHCGINIVGRGRKLRINYRTTEETHNVALSVLKGSLVDNLDGGIDTSKGYISLMNGIVPEQTLYPTFKDECNAIVEILKSLETAGAFLNDICLVARTNSFRNDYMSALEKAGIKCHEIKTNASESRSVEGVRLGTMHRVKGLEFQHVLVVGVNKDVVPLGVFASDDPIEIRNFELNERALLHVAMTRAIKSLFVTSWGAPSKFLSSVENKGKQ